MVYAPYFGKVVFGKVGVGYIHTLARSMESCSYRPTVDNSDDHVVPVLVQLVNIENLASGPGHVGSFAGDLSRESRRVEGRLHGQELMFKGSHQICRLCFRPLL